MDVNYSISYLNLFYTVVTMLYGYTVCGNTVYSDYIICGGYEKNHWFKLDVSISMLWSSFGESIL